MLALREGPAKIAGPLLRKAMRVPQLRETQSFLRKGTGALPDFLIIGGMRCGTTSLFMYLAQHPAVLLSRIKEVHFFDLHYSQGLYWYRSQFPSVFRKYSRSARLKECAVGEATPNYIFDSKTPALVARMLPQVKLIALLRNPVDRAYSQYVLMRARHDIKGLSFEQAIANENGRILRRGIYVDQLERWVKYFPRKQMLVLRSEDLFHKTQETFERVLGFIGVFPIDLVFKAYEAFEYDPMNSATRDRLLHYFAPHNKRLYEFLGEDFGWGS
jgi:hypothetical protein